MRDGRYAGFWVGIGQFLSLFLSCVLTSPGRKRKWYQNRRKMSPSLLNMTLGKDFYHSFAWHLSSRPTNIRWQLLYKMDEKSCNAYTPAWRPMRKLQKKKIAGSLKMGKKRKNVSNNRAPSRAQPTQQENHLVLSFPWTFVPKKKGGIFWTASFKPWYIDLCCRYLVWYVFQKLC